MQVILSHHLSPTSCWASPQPELVRNGICRHVHIIFRRNSGTRVDARTYMTVHYNFCIDTESDFSCQNIPLCRLSSSRQSALPSNGMQEKTVVLFVSYYCLCFQRLVHVLSTENTLPRSSQRRLCFPSDSW